MEKVNLDLKKIIKNIWFSPKATLRYALKSNNRFTIYILLFLGAIAYGFYKGINDQKFEDITFLNLVLLYVIASGLFGLISIYIFTSILRLTGEFLGGNASGSEYRSALAWSSIPAIVGLFLLIPGYLILGLDILQGFAAVYESPIYSTINTIFFIIYYALMIWSLVIFVRGIQLIQNFSLLRTIGNLLLPSVVFMVLIFLILSLLSLGGVMSLF